MFLRFRGIEPRSPAWQARILPLNHQSNSERRRPSILCALQLDFSLVSILQFIECKNVEKNQMFSMIIIVHPSHVLIYQSVIDVVKTMWMLCGLYPLVIESYS